MTKSSNPSESKQLEPGTIVHLKQVEIGTSLGIGTYHKRGGEGEIISVSQDEKGDLYSVRIFRNDRVRQARREDLVVRRKKNKERKRRERAKAREKARNKKR